MAPSNALAPPRVLIVEYDRGGGADIEFRLTTHCPGVVLSTITGSELTGAIAEQSWEAVIVDFDWDGTAADSRQTLSFLTQWLPQSATIAIVDSADDVTVRRLTHQGAWDVLA